MNRDRDLAKLFLCRKDYTCQSIIEAKGGTIVPPLYLPIQKVTLSPFEIFDPG
jgi:hypothetical protein